MKKLTLITAAVLGLTTTAASAQPVQNVSAARHGNIAAAQRYTKLAYDAMTAAQSANEYDLGGHATHAKQLLTQAADEMKQAARSANRR